MNKNTELFINTIDSLASSQGFYRRLSQSIHRDIEQDNTILDDFDKNLPKFNDMLDVVMYLEQ